MRPPQGGDPRPDAAVVASLLHEQRDELLEGWLRTQLAVLSGRPGKVDPAVLRRYAADFLQGFGSALSADPGGDTRRPEWRDLRDLLGEFSRDRARQGFSPTETATFVFSLKQTLFAGLRAKVKDPERLADAIWSATLLLDALGLITVEAYIREREDVIRRQQQEMLELSTPVVRLWQNILALPLIGTLDSARTQVVMESLLQEIVRTGASIAIIDITGVPTVDTLVAQHLLKTVAAARLMGADCIISGIRPQIAQTIVHLGVDLGDVTTKGTLAEALSMALKRLGHAIVAQPR